jgi:general stress protein YciG
MRLPIRAAYAGLGKCGSVHSCVLFGPTGGPPLLSIAHRNREDNRIPPIPFHARRARPSQHSARRLCMAEQRHTGNPGNFAEDREKASRAGQIGGQHSSGNFANDRERAAEAGRKGGEHSHGGGGSEHNRGNFAQDRERAAEAGRKGGQR